MPVLWGMRDVALIYYSSCIDSSKPGLHFSCNFVVINASEGSVCFQIFILHNSRCHVLCGSCKNFPFTSLQYCYIFLVLRDHWYQHYLVLRIWVPLKPVLEGVRDFALIHYPSCTDSIKPSVQCSCNFVVINASEGSLCFQFFHFDRLSIILIEICYKGTLK
jgi:hypothetical protein